MHSNKLHHVKTDKLTVIKFCEWKENINDLKKTPKKGTKPKLCMNSM